MQVKKGLDNNYKITVSELYLSALGEKLIPILGNTPKALKLLNDSINPSNCFSVHTGSELLGFLAFQDESGGFLDFSLKNITSTYGLFIGLVKAIQLSFLGHKLNPGEIYIEAIAIHSSARGKGIGTQLIQSLITYAKDSNYKTVTLNVINTNNKAKELYERLGFIVIKQSTVWPINKIIGWPFNEVFLMQKKLT